MLIDVNEEEMTDNEGYDLVTTSVDLTEEQLKDKIKEMEQGDPIVLDNEAIELLLYFSINA